MQKMHGIIPQLFDCWADPVAHLLLLKSSMDIATRKRDLYQIILDAALVNLMKGCCDRKL